MNLPIKLTALLFSGLALASDADGIYGKYVTVSDAECIQIIELLPDNHAVFAESCNPDPEYLYSAHNSFPTQWELIGSEVTIKMPSESVKFKLAKTMACENIGKSGLSATLVGYGTVFWITPFTCK